MQFTVNKDSQPEFRFDGGDFNSLIGVKVADFKINTAHDNFQIVSKSGAAFGFHCDADCCSESWIEHVTGIGSLLGGTIFEITRAESVSVPATRQESEYIDVYTIKTEKGRFDIEFRNSSNGYYGGAIESGIKCNPDFLSSLKEDF